MSTLAQVEFVLEMPQARSASVAGNFNNWNPMLTPMEITDHGYWKSVVVLPPGRYEYQFVVDGKWIADPRAEEQVPSPFGRDNSVLVVTQPARVKGSRMVW